jgi:DNA-binding NarL/FixJ family response regulator
MTVCGQAADLQAAVLLAGELRPDVCLLDVSLSGGALEALHRMRERAPETRVVMLATSPDHPSLLAAVRAGASGCIVGLPGGPALGRALADVMAGHTALPRTLLTRLVATLGPA